MEEMWQLWTTHSHDVMAKLCTQSHDVITELWRVWDLVQQSVVAMLGVLLQVAEAHSTRDNVWGLRLAVGFAVVLLMAMMFRIVFHVSQEVRGVSTKKQRGRKLHFKPKSLHTPGLGDLDLFDLAKTAYRPGYATRVAEEVERRQLDINQTLPSTGMSLFLCACLSGSHELVRKLIKKGADMKVRSAAGADTKVRSSAGDSALYLTVYCCTCSHLFIHTCTGADMQVRSAAGDSALYLAVYGCTCSHQTDLSLVRILIDAGCDVNAANDRGNTPLHQAAMSGNIPLIKLLLKHGHLVAAKLLRINISAPHQVWDVVEPHTPLKVTLGFMTPSKHHLADSSFSQKRLMFHSC
uniref:Uncharacterized protein n=1 Tax=Branchiostoma floridae TaxID=7739 RepID=C3ZNV6_BRAFL|eukprot:XP_002589680.1 hypothetical protein BRAFLDRAFT_100807 [Branchiostoma floridae]